tara:strand:- start:94 stop:339 length:246 start_codon:yes stop_codon:yes gene_type:complete
MLIDGRSHKVLELKDMNSLVSFEQWLKQNLSIYPKNGSVPEGDLKIFLEYLKNQVEEQRLEDKAQWKEKLRSLGDWMERKD